METRSPIPFTLSLRARTDGEWLLVDYEAKNAGTETVYCYDGAPGEPGQDYPDLSTHLGLFVRWGEPARVSVKRILGAPPPGRKVTRVIVPSLSRLDAGQSREVLFRLPLPLVEKSEFSPHFAQAAYETRTAKTLEVVLGYMVLPPGSAAEPFSGNPRAWKVRGAHGPQQLATASTSLAVSVKVRTDESFYCP